MERAQPGLAADGSGRDPALPAAEAARRWADSRNWPLAKFANGSARVGIPLPMGAAAVLEAIDVASDVVVSDRAESDATDSRDSSVTRSRPC